MVLITGQGDVCYGYRKKISRTEYVALASKNKSAAKKLFEIKATQTTCARVGKSFAKRANTAVTVEVKQKD